MGGEGGGVSAQTILFETVIDTNLTSQKELMEAKEMIHHHVRTIKEVSPFFSPIEYRIHRSHPQGKDTC